MLPKRALQLQDQLENIEQEANTYFEKEAASGRPENFNSLEPEDRKRCSELQWGVSNVVGELLGAIADSPLFDEPDQQTLRDGGRRADRKTPLLHRPPKAVQERQIVIDKEKRTVQRRAAAQLALRVVPSLGYCHLRPVRRD